MWRFTGSVEGVNLDQMPKIPRLACLTGWTFGDDAAPLFII